MILFHLRYALKTKNHPIYYLFQQYLIYSFHSNTPLDNQILMTNKDVLQLHLLTNFSEMIFFVMNQYNIFEDECTLMNTQYFMK